MDRVVKILVRPFVTGAVAVLPLVLTIGIVAWLANVVVGLMGPQSALGGLLKQFGWNFGTGDTGAYIGGVLMSILLIYAFGLLVQIGLKSRWETITDALLLRLPVVKTVYDAAKKMVQMVEPSERPDMQSMIPVMCQFGGDGGTGFPALLPTPKTVSLHGAECHVIMIPTAPVPFGGALMCVPKEWVTKLDCGIDGLFNMYMSMGTTVPDYVPR